MAFFNHEHIPRLGELVLDLRTSQALNISLKLSESNHSCHESNMIVFLSLLSDDEIDLIASSLKTLFYKWIIVILPIIVGFGWFGYIAFLFTVAYDRKLRANTTNFFIVNLAVADMMYMSLKIFPEMWRWQTVHSNRGCIVKLGLESVSFFASVFLITTVSFERYLALCHPVKHRLMNSRKRGCILVIVSWLAALIFVAAILPGAAIHQSFCIVWPPRERYKTAPTTYNLCLPITEFAFYAFITHLIPFFSSLIIIIVLYVKIMKQLCKRSRMASNKQQKQNACKHGKRVTRMVIISGLVFFICLAPYQFAYLFFFSVHVSDGHHNLTPVQQTKLWEVLKALMTINSSINPYIYFVTNVNYQNSFKRAVRRCCRLQRAQVVPLPSSTT